MARFKKASDIKVGVIGYGGAFNMGRAHLNLMKEAGMTPQAVAEIDAERLKVAEQEFPGIKTFTSVAEMLKKGDVNLVTIITPHNTHAKLAAQCLQAGCHVCCEKPLAITTAECDQMIATAKKKKLVISTYHNRHWDGAIVEAVKLKNKGVFGDILRIEGHMGGFGKPGDWWRSSKSISGGILYDWGVHLLEYSLQLIDSDITEVTGFAKSGFWQTKWKDDTNEDEAAAIVRFKSGQYINLRMTHLDRNVPRGRLEVVGTKANWIMLGDNDYELIEAGDGKKTTTAVKTGPNQYVEYYKNLANHLVKNEKLIITAEWSRRPIHILDLADRSAKAGKTLRAKHG